MTRYREIMRLHSLGQPNKDIALATNCSTSTVGRVLKAMDRAGLCWPLPQDMGDDAIKQIIYPKKRKANSRFKQPNYIYIHEQLKRKGVTRSLLYEEYKDQCRADKAKPCSITTFNKGYLKWTASQNLTMHIERKPAQKMEVDWAGTKMALVDRDTGEFIDIYIFVACLPFSGKLFAEGFFSMASESWLTAHVHAFDFFGGVPQEIVPDNCKTAVIKHGKDKNPILNRAYASMVEYYGCAIAPARIRHPKDKANVEAGVGMVTRHAIAALRDCTFFTLGELNAALMEKVTQINTAQFTRKPGSRASVFETQEKSELAPLPKMPFPVCSWERATVRSDYHVAVAKCFYSVPFEYIGKVVDVRVTQSTIEVFFQDIRIASHVRSHEEHGYVTNSQHMPENHRNYLSWDTNGLAKRAADIGTSCERAMALIVGSQTTKQKSLGQGRALLALKLRFGASILESACKKALDISGGLAVSVEQIECLCVANWRTDGDIEDKGEHAILRGKNYYEKMKER